MHVLIIGGTRFVGYLLTWRLLAGGHRATLFHRGTSRDPFGSRVEHVLGDRTTDDFERLLQGRRFDAVVDFAAFTGEEVTRAIALFQGSIGHYVFISTGQVYLIRGREFACPERPAREEDYHGPVIARPTENASDIASWDYGIGKRRAEDALIRAFSETKFPGTRIRIPMVNGPRDYYRRLDEYIVRLLDGGPILLPDGGKRPTRHVHADDVARAIASLLTDGGAARTAGEAYNLAQEETPTLRELVGVLAEHLGASPTFVEATSEAIAADVGLEPRDFSPFSGKWMSFLDPGKAKAQLGFRATPLRTALSQVVASYLSAPPADDPEGYVHRVRERAYAERLLGLSSSSASPSSPSSP